MNDAWINDFLKMKGMGPDAIIPDEAAFYGEFTDYVFRRGSDGVASPGNDALIGGFMKSLGIDPSTPIQEGGEAAFYGRFIKWVFNQGMAVRKSPPPVIGTPDNPWRGPSKGAGHF